MTPDSPEIARLRHLSELRCFDVSVRTSDLRYALALIDNSCRSCAFVDEIRKQGERLNRMYDLFHEMMREHPRTRGASTGTDRPDPMMHTCSKPCHACDALTIQLLHGSGR